jgi:hypothetical protein
MSEFAGGPPDQELDAVLGHDEALLALAGEVRGVLHETEIDPQFMRELGARVVEERRRVLAAPPRRRWWRMELRWPRALLPAGGVAAAAAALALVLTILVPRAVQPPAVRVAATSALGGLASVAPSSPVVVHFDRPMDQAAVASALRITPATAARIAWRGNDLVVTPLHGLAPNAPYVLTIDRTRARTAAGAALAADLHVVFGTAPVAVAGAAPPSPAALTPRAAAPADDGSEAVVAGDGSLIATSASKYGFSGLLRLRPDGIVERLAPSTNAICVSRSGRSLAYLDGTGAGATIVMAAPDGSGGQPFHVAVDDGSPLGWINDGQVSFVGGGRLRAVDRAGRVVELSPVTVDAAHDTVVIAPGGRYVFLRPAGAAAGAGQLIDVVSGASHPLPGIVGDPAFSADGATAVWVDGTGQAPLLARAASGGGPVLTTSLGLAAGDRVSDLGVAPDGSRLVYSVQHPGGGAELRLAALDDGATLAVARGEQGGSPNWSPTGSQFTVLGRQGARAQIEVVDVPSSDAADSAGALAAAFANAQVSGDRDAMRALGTAGLDVGRLPVVSRASVVEMVPGAGGSVQVGLRLVLDPTPTRPVARAIAETLDLRPDGPSGRLVVAGASAAAPADVPQGPHATRISPGAAPGTVTVTFDSDLDPTSVAGAVGLRSAGGGPLSVRTAYDPGSRTVTVTAPSGLSGSLALSVGTGLRDVAGQHLAVPVQAPVAVTTG